VGWGYETGRALMFMVMANCARTRTRRRAETCLGLPAGKPLALTSPLPSGPPSLCICRANEAHADKGEKRWVSDPLWSLHMTAQQRLQALLHAVLRREAEITDADEVRMRPSESDTVSVVFASGRARVGW